MANGRYSMKIDMTEYLSENDLVMTKFGTLIQILTTIKYFTKIQIFKFNMVYGRHIENIVFGDRPNSTADCPIFAKFCTKMQDPRVMMGESENLQNLEIQDGGQSSFEMRNIAKFQ